MDNLRTLTTFIRIANVGNFSRAARELGITPQAASNHVKQLEHWVGTRLFYRTTHKISLTESGAAFYQTCVTAVEAIEHGVQALRETSDEIFGTVRVVAPHGLGRRFVAPVIGRFLELHPKVSVELIVQNQVPDLVTQGIDVGVFSYPLEEYSVVARKFATMRTVLCAAPSYLKKHGTPKTLEDLARHRCINLRNWSTGKVAPWMFRLGDNVITQNIDAKFTTNDGDSEMEAVLSGAGIAQLSAYRVAPYIRSRKLKTLLLDYVSDEHDLYIYMPRQKRVPRKNRIFADFLFEQLSAHPDLQPLIHSAR